MTDNIMQVEVSKFVARAVKQTLAGIVARRFPAIKAEILLQPSPKGQFEYLSASAMKEFNVHKNKKEGHTYGVKSVAEFAKQICGAFEPNSVIGKLESNEKGFIFIQLTDKFIEERVNSIVKNLDYPEIKSQRVVVDFSSPNIAKEMHVGHLRSTIIGESVCRMLEYMGHHVVRANHVGDWGTQFGMLIAYMRQQFPDYETNFPDIRDLDEYYKGARKRFDSDPVFKKISQETVVRLQAYGEVQIKAWKMICAVSRDYFMQIYKRLGITIDQFGESFYNPFIPKMIVELEQLKLITEDDTKTKRGVKVEDKVEKAKKQPQKPSKKDKSQQTKEEAKAEKKAEIKTESKVEAKQQDSDQEIEDVPEEGKKAKCIFLEKYNIPLIVVKSDGGYNYDTTDLAAVQYRLLNIKMDRAIYITDSGQREHFEMIYAAARKAGWLTTQRFEHMGFGCVLGEDGKKFKTRNGLSIKLLDLLNQAKQKALKQLKSREKGGEKEREEGEEVAKEASFTALKPEEYDDAAEKLGIAAIKYFDLKQNRISDYTFSFEKMLDPKGNTAVYLIYAYVRICSIIRKSGLSSAQIAELSKQKSFIITHPDERALAGMLIKFYDVIDESVDDLQLNKVTDFIYEICVKVQENYKKYRIVGDQNLQTRILLCEAIRKVLEKAFFFVGIVPIDRI